MSEIRQELEATIAARGEVGKELEPQLVEQFVDRIEGELERRASERAALQRRRPREVPLALPRYTGPIEFRQNATDADNEGVATSAAVYAQDQIEFTPHWQPIIGLRYDHFDVDFINHRVAVGNPNRDLDSTDGLWSPRAGLVYKPIEPVSIYASYSVA